MRARLDGLHLTQPQLPASWDSFTRTRVLHGTRYEMTVHRGDRNELLIDGQAAEPGRLALTKQMPTLFNGPSPIKLSWPCP